MSLEDMVTIAAIVVMTGVGVMWFIAAYVGPIGADIAHVRECFSELFKRLAEEDER